MSAIREIVRSAIFAVPKRAAEGRPYRVAGDNDWHTMSRVRGVMAGYRRFYRLAIERREYSLN